MIKLSYASIYMSHYILTFIFFSQVMLYYRIHVSNRLRRGSFSRQGRFAIFGRPEKSYFPDQLYFCFIFTLFRNRPFFSICISSFSTFAISFSLLHCNQLSCSKSYGLSLLVIVCQVCLRVIDLEHTSYLHCILAALTNRCIFLLYIC